MTVEILRQFWALLAASVIGTAVALFVVYRLWTESARGRLHLRARELRRRERSARRADRAAGRAARTLERLRARAASVRPRRIEEAAGRLADAEALREIAADRVLIARNLLRQVIVEDYPPRRHEALRNRYLPGLQRDDKPFSF